MREHFGDRLKELRLKKNLTQEELAKIINTGKASISHYESNKRVPDIETIEYLAKFFDVSIDYLLGASDVKKQDNKFPESFNTAEEAMKFILKDNTIMAHGGFDINKLTDDEVIDFANELLNQLKLLSYKYKK